MLFGARGGWHIDNSFDELGDFDLGMGLVAALELGARQAVAGIERGRRWVRRLRRHARHTLRRGAPDALRPGRGLGWCGAIFGGCFRHFGRRCLSGLLVHHDLQL